MLEPSPLPPDDRRAEDARRRLEREHELDQAPLGNVASEDPDPRAELLDPPTTESFDSRAPTMPRRTRLLLLALVATVCFLAGMQVQKIVGGGSERTGPAPATGDPPAEAGSPAAHASGAVRGEILVVDDATLYLRGADGRTFSVLTGPAARLSSGRLIHRGDLRPGESVIANARRRSDGRLQATSITVLRPSAGDEP